MTFDKISLHRGFIWQLRLQIDELDRTIIAPGIGYVLGAQYNFNNKLSIGTEVLPMLSLNVDDRVNRELQVNVDLLINNHPQFYVIYHITR